MWSLLLAALAFAADADHDVVAFPDQHFALRYAHRTQAPVLIYAAERDTLRTSVQPIFRPGARHSLTIYEDLSGANVKPSKNGPPRCMLESYAGGLPADPLGKAFRGSHKVKEVKLDRAAFCTGAGITEDSRAAVTAFKHYEAEALQSHQAVHVYAWSTQDHASFVLGRRGDAPEKLAVEVRLGLAGVKGNIRLEELKYHYVHH